MVFTLVGWSQSIDTGGVLSEIDALADPHIRVEGKKIVVPSLNQLLGAMAVGANITQARISSPSLRSIAEIEISPLNANAEPLSPPSYVDLFQNPIALVVSEQLTSKVAETASGAEYETVLAWLGDGPVTPYRGPFYTVRATGSTTLSAYAWTNVSITFDQTLPAGRYQIIGMRAMSAGLIAARLVFPGFPWRPGVIGNDALSDIEAERFRFGNAGVFGEFTHDSPPTVDCLSVSADTSETFWFDLVKIA
jgi:hypothetical protein